MASEMTADGSAQPILAMQSSVSPLHGLSPWDVAAFIISAHSSLICDAVTAALDIAGADAKATSWAKRPRSEEHTSELQSLMRISYAVFCLKKKKQNARNRYQDLRQTSTQHTPDPTT